MFKTRPFLRARLAVYGVFFFATLGFYSTFVLWLHASKSIVYQLLIIAIAAVLILLARRYFGRYLTYSGHAPHIQAMVAAMSGEKLPKGHNQIEEYTRVVDKKYPDVARLVQLEQLIYRTLRDARELVRYSNPAAAAATPAKFARIRSLIHTLALRRFGDAVFAYTIYVGDPNVWQSARRGVVLFTQSAEKLTKTALRVYVVGLFTWVVFACLLLWATWTSVFSWAGHDGIATVFVVSAGLAMAAWVIKTALYNPVAMTWTFSVFLRRLDEEGGSVDAVWAERLEESSKRFRELTERAKHYAQHGSKLTPIVKPDEKPPAEEPPDEEPPDEEPPATPDEAQE